MNSFFRKFKIVFMNIGIHVKCYNYQQNCLEKYTITIKHTFGALYILRVFSITKTGNIMFRK